MGRCCRRENVFTTSPVRFGPRRLRGGAKCPRLGFSTPLKPVPDLISLVVRPLGPISASGALGSSARTEPCPRFRGARSHSLDFRDDNKTASRALPISSYMRPASRHFRIVRAGPPGVNTGAYGESIRPGVDPRPFPSAQAVCAASQPVGKIGHRPNECDSGRHLPRINATLHPTREGPDRPWRERRKAASSQSCR